MLELWKPGNTHTTRRTYTHTHPMQSAVERLTARIHSRMTTPPRTGASASLRATSTLFLLVAALAMAGGAHAFTCDAPNSNLPAAASGASDTAFAKLRDNGWFRETGKLAFTHDVNQQEDGSAYGGAAQAEMQPSHNSKAPGYNCHNPWKLYKVMSWFLKPFGTLLLQHATCTATVRLPWRDDLRAADLRQRAVAHLPPGRLGRARHGGVHQLMTASMVPVTNLPHPGVTNPVARMVKNTNR
jgi:hypothetical protein